MSCETGPPRLLYQSYSGENSVYGSSAGGQKLANRRFMLQTGNHKLHDNLLVVHSQLGSFPENLHFDKACSFFKSQGCLKRLQKTNEVMTLLFEYSVICCALFWIVSVRGQLYLNNRQKEFIEERETVATGLALYATELHSRRVQFVRGCECSKHGCSNDFLDVPCEFHFGMQPFCETEGWRLDYSDTIFRTPPGANPNNFSDITKENICVYKHLHDYLVQFNESNYSWTYVGTLDGHFRRYPASARERGEEEGDPFLGGCRKYDPRVRPWFIAASTGPKDIVLVVDRSESMNEIVGIGNRTKWDLTVAAVERILETFTITDFVNVVMFSDKATPLNEKGLLRGSREHLQILREKISEVHPKGKTNFRAAFTAAFDQLSNYCDEEIKTCSNCIKIILFLTDGRDTSGFRGESVKPSEMANTIDELQEELVNKTKKRASIFTYSMSEQADDSIPRQIGCANDGAWAFIGLTTDPLNALNSYYLYIAAGRKNLNPIWLEPYLDAAGTGMETTVAIPFFAKGTERIPHVFLGVAGHDVRLDEFNGTGFTHEEVLNSVIDRSERCTLSDSSPCELQAYRNSRDPRGVCTDPFPINEHTRSGSKFVDVECYQFHGRFYKRFPKTVNWEDAQGLCLRDGGQLVSIEDKTELAFVANLASMDGSWVGARRDKDNYTWLDEDARHIPEDSAFWGVGEPNQEEGLEDCVVIDTRGIISNLRAEPCFQQFSYICRYNSKKRCKAGVAQVPKKGYFEIPPLDVCDYVVEVLDETRPTPDAAKLNSTEVMCPIGKPKRTTEEVICCAGVDKEN